MAEAFDAVDVLVRKVDAAGKGDLAVDYDIVKKSGSWYTYGEERLGQGREAAKETLATTPDLYDEINHLVRVACGLEFGDEPVGEPLLDGDAGAFDAAAPMGLE